MKKLKVLIPVIALTLTLQACSSSKTEDIKTEVETYNKTVNQTLSDYGATKVYIKENMEDVERYLLTDKDVSKVIASDIKERVKPLTKKQRKEFSDWGTKLSDDYFTAYSSKGIRQVLVYTGYENEMVVTINWLKDEITNIERTIR